MRARPRSVMPLLLWVGVAILPLIFAWFVIGGRRPARHKVVAGAFLLGELAVLAYSLELGTLLPALKLLQAL